MSNVTSSSLKNGILNIPNDCTIVIDEIYQELETYLRILGPKIKSIRIDGLSRDKILLVMKVHPDFIQSLKQEEILGYLECFSMTTLFNYRGNNSKELLIKKLLSCNQELTEEEIEKHEYNYVNLISHMIKECPVKVPKITNKSLIAIILYNDPSYLFSYNISFKETQKIIHELMMVLSKDNLARLLLAIRIFDHSSEIFRREIAEIEYLWMTYKEKPYHELYKQYDNFDGIYRKYMR